MRQKGFTLIEILVTVTILAVLASIVIPLSKMTVKRGKEAELRQNLRMIRSAIDAHKKAWDEGKIKKNIGDSGYPPDLKTLEDGVDDATSPQAGKKLRFLRRVPADPLAPNDGTTRASYETWGLRSYDSGPDEPKEGTDVFDIYSKSDDTALDGTAYKNW